MIVLDTNVLSELMRLGRADPAMMTWFRSLSEQPVTTAVTRAEVLLGVALLPPGQRRETLRRDVNTILDEVGTSLPFTDPCAEHFADFVADRRRIGRQVEVTDALIAAICLDARATLATRNTGDFEGVGLDLVNPWADR